MPGVAVETLSAALQRAKAARLHLLAVMEAALPAERGDQARRSSRACHASLTSKSNRETRPPDGQRCCGITPCVSAPGSDPVTFSNSQAPTWGTVGIDRELIGRLIGPKGSSIQALEASTGARLAIFDDAGSVQVRSRTLHDRCSVTTHGPTTIHWHLVD